MRLILDSVFSREHDMNWNHRVSLAGILICGIIIINSFANPTLVPGVWTNLTPSGGSYWCNDVQIAPGNPNILFACMSNSGPSKSTDGGSTWASIHGNSTINSPQRIRIDPNNINHIYTICGVGGNTGFFVTTDGGANWNIPAGYDSVGKIINDYDMYYIDVDPTDFNHIILSYHYYWYGGMDAGVVESFDGGKHCIIHPIPNVSNGGYNVFFLYNPKLGIGDNKTWLYCTQGAVGGAAGTQGFWRTTNSGTSWEQVTANWMTHGGTQIYYAKTGVLYAAWEEGVQHSTNNGKTWEALSSGLNSRYYYSVHGDGNSIYTVASRGAMYSSLETDGKSWTLFNSRSFSDGVTMLNYDSANGIMYAAGRSEGVWALKMPGTATGAQKSIAAANPSVKSIKNSLMVLSGNQSYSRQKSMHPSNMMNLYDFRGKLIHQGSSTPNIPSNGIFVQASAGKLR
jgi:hypothetical protein